MKSINFKNYLAIVIGITFIIITVVGITFHKQIKRIIYRLYNWEYIIYGDSSCENCEFLFTDGTTIHQRAYECEGIKPKKKFDDVRKLIASGKLIEINTTEDYIVEPMDNSLPSILPKGFKFINRLSKEYKNLCVTKKLEYIPFRITSATRTLESIKLLRKRNGNAIENSAHLKGKTIDISYLFSKRHLKQKNLFIKSLDKLKKEKLCYVKFEMNMKCLHITVR